MEPKSSSESRTPRTGRTALRLLRCLASQPHVFLACLMATGVYAGMMTLRVAMLYPVLRVIQTHTPAEEKGAPGTGSPIEVAPAPGAARAPSGETGGRSRPGWGVTKLLTDKDSKFSPFLARVNGLLDGIDGVIGDTLAPILPRKVRNDPKTLSQVASLSTAILGFLFMAIVAAAAHYAEHIAKAVLVLRVLISLRIRLLKNLLFQPLAFYNDRQRGELISRMGADVHCATAALQLMSGDLLQHPIAIVMAIAGIAFIQPWLLLIVCIFMPVFMMSLRRQSRKVHRRAKVRQQTTAKVTEAMVQMFSGIRVVKAFGLERQKVAEYTARNQDFARDSMATEVAKGWTRTKMEFMTHMAMVLAVAAAMIVLGTGGNLPGGAMLLFVGFLVQMFRPMKSLVTAYTDLQDNLSGAERMFEYIDVKPGLQDKPGAIPLTDVVGGVRFEDVCFSYGGNGRVLDHVNLEIPAGQVVALVGPSGAGKSTLANLVPRFYDPESGRITIDGTDIREFTRESLLRNIAIVTQEPFLFNTTIRENIGHGKPGATEEEIVAAAKAANIHDFILSLPEGYDTVVGERGSKLSGGQCQRLTIARAILKNARILILDEATSSLDTESERAVQLALQNLMRGRTTLVIAHRLSTIQHADKICVLQDGRVVDVGTHDELMARDSLYRRLHEMQFATV